ncbi:DUF3151 domain-containing protein [Mumia sp. Pv 4-285]|uniref:DUF3151 domain-containing protein n=1 Tax=Mumia qirimensis TaxID=3234852 RepID=UPI00351CC897
MTNLFGEPPETLLPTDPAASADGSPQDVARAYPSSSLAWALCADEALAGGEDVVAYAFARTGYHRGLDALRRNGWKGHGPVPWTHPGNQGFLRALADLAEASERIGDLEEAHRCREFLRESSKDAYEALVLGR